MYDFDLFTIGAGSGGVRASRIAAQHGAKVAVAEERYLGGTCVNVGCVPKKLMVYAAQYGHDLDDAAGFGWAVGPSQHDWATLIANKDREIARLNGIYRRLLEAPGVTILDGRARLVDAHTVAVGDQRYTARNILIAVGGWPTLPDLPGIQHAITSNDVFRLPARPERIVIVGGGYIATEFACMFNGLGSKVTQLYRGDKILRGFDDDVRAFVGQELIKSGIDLRVNQDVARIDPGAGAPLSVTLRDGTRLDCDAVLYATGRRPMTADLGLEAASVALRDDGAIQVDAQWRTNVPHIYAIGDVTDRVNLTPVAIAEGHALADTLFGNRPRGISYDNIPSAVFSIPPVASCGLTEAQARARYGAVDIYRADFRPMRHTLTGRDQRTLMKLIVDRVSDRVVGCHMVGADTPEMIQGVAVAMNAGATKAVFDATLGLHPTAAEEFVTMRTKVAELG